MVSHLPQRGLHAADHAHTYAPSTCPRVSPRSAQRCVAAGSTAFSSPEFREQARLLSRLFYGSGAAGGKQPPGEGPSAAGSAPTEDAGLGAFALSRLADLPLWRLRSCALPGQQVVLHVHTPAYMHMFDGLLAQPKPWLFGHVYLPHGPRSLGEPEYSLSVEGSRAPRVGVLMEVSRAVRLADGRLMVLCTALARIKVLESHRETPYTRARVALHHESEVLEAHHALALQAVLEASDAAQHPDLTVADTMRLAADVAASAATASATAWLEYEVATARAASWEDGPRESSSEAESKQLLAEIVDHGVLDVLPLPDGPVVGRWELAALGERAEEAAQRATADTTSQVLAKYSTAARGAGAAADGGPADAATALLRDSSVDPELGLAGFGARSAGPGALLGSSQPGGWWPVDSNDEEEEQLILACSRDFCLSGDTEADLAHLEEQLWEDLDAVALLMRQVHQRKLGLPLGLLQLRPALPKHDTLGVATTDQLDVPAAELAPATGSSGQPEGLHYAASEGLDVAADPKYPPLRRWLRLSYAAAIAFTETGSAAQRQALLECPSILSRMCAALTRVHEVRQVLAAKAAVKTLGHNKRSDG